MAQQDLAIDGGIKAVPDWPARHLFGKAEQQAVTRLFDRAVRTGNAFGYNGPEEEAYCREFAAYLGGGYADGVNSGTSAVYVALRALGVPAFSEVICGPVSDMGGIMPIPLAGCIPVPADSEPGSFNMDPDSVARRLNRRTGAIIVTHIAGIPADVGPILKLARARGVPVIEDCAQAHGATYRGRPVGTWGDIAAFSTMSGKHHASGAQGGMVFTRREELYWCARRCSDRGKPFNVDGARGNVLASQNLNSNDLSACIGRVQLGKLPRIVAARRRSARALAAECRRRLKAFRIVEGPSHVNPAFWFLLGQLDLTRLRVDKATFVAALQAEGVPCMASYLHLFLDQDWYRNRAVFEGSQFPWDSPCYKGNPDRSYPVPNVRKTDMNTFGIGWHEKITQGTIRRIVKALQKVEAVYVD